MNFLAMMFNSFSLSHAVMKRSFRKAMGRRSGAGFRKNELTVATARGLILAYAMAHKAKRDIAFLSAPKM